MSKPKIQILRIPDDGLFPNNDVLPLILMQIKISDPYRSQQSIQFLGRTDHCWKYGKGVDILIA
jgi:hypothetical protein